MALDKALLKKLQGIVEGKLPVTQDMSDPKTMTDLLEAQKTYGTKVDLVAKEIFGFNASELSPEQWGKVKKVLDIVAAEAEKAIVAEPVVEEPVVAVPEVEEVAPVVEDLPVEEAKKNDLAAIEKEEGDKEEKELKSKK